MRRTERTSFLNPGAYSVGIVTSRRIERACCEDLAFRVLTGKQQPDQSRN